MLGGCKPVYLIGLVTRRLATFLGSGKDVLDAVGTPEHTTAARKALISRARTQASSLAKAPDPEKRALLLATLSQLVVAEDHVEIVISKHKLRAALLADPKCLPTESPSKPTDTDSDSEDLLRLRIDARVLRCGMDVRLIVPPDSGDERPPRMDTALLKAVARGYVWSKRLLNGEAKSLAAIARDLGVHPRYVGKILRCGFLAPDIVEAILEGKQPPQLTLEQLHRGVPLAWDEQRRLFGAPQ